MYILLGGGNKSYFPDTQTHSGPIALPEPLNWSVKAKFHYASWFEAGRRQVRSQIPLRCLVQSWFKAGGRDRFEAGRRPASNQLRTR